MTGGPRRKSRLAPEPAGRPPALPAVLHATCAALAVLCAACAAPAAHAQSGAGPAQAQRPSGREGAAFDLTGTWVSIVSEDWRHRMMTAPRGDYESVPLTPAARALADEWDPQADMANGEECKAYGAPGVTRMPGRMRIGWRDDETLELEFDAGMQTRLLHFDEPDASGAPSSQGHSFAQWHKLAQNRGLRGGTGGTVAPVQGGPGSLAVSTTNLLPGYLRRNGVPYSADALLTEYFDRFDLPNGEEWLLLTTIVDDPEMLTQRFVVSSQFKREPDHSGWNPVPCRTR